MCHSNERSACYHIFITDPELKLAVGATQLPLGNCTTIMAFIFLL